MRPGEVVGLLGRNGVGKSTTLKTIMGIVRPSSGRIVFDGRDIAGLPPYRLARVGIGYVPEDRRIFAGMTVRENLILGGYTRRNDLEIEQDIDTLATLFPILGKRFSQAAGTLSGGEQQMLAIARGLMSRPSLLVMDEPTMGLAPQMIDVILDKVQEIRDRGTTVLLVEQNAVEAIRLSDDVYVMRLGRVVHKDTGSGIDPDLVKAFYMGVEP